MLIKQDEFSGSMIKPKVHGEVERKTRKSPWSLLKNIF